MAGHGWGGIGASQPRAATPPPAAVRRQQAIAGPAVNRERRERALKAAMAYRYDIEVTKKPFYFLASGRWDGVGG